MIIAIDGPAGSGKSSTAKSVAVRLGFIHLDTGAMYRAVTLKAMAEDIAFTDDSGLELLLQRTQISFAGSPPNTRIVMDGVDISDAVRSDTVTKNVSDYCARSVVREALVEQQRTFGSRVSCVCEGRDIGTVVFPNAELKIFMVASVEERARRRQHDFAALGVQKSVDELVEDIFARDQKDSGRANSPLRKAQGAVEIDTTGLTFQQQVQAIVDLALARGAQAL